MGRSEKMELPSYQRIAVDLAENIARGNYTVGQKLSGRTTLAAHYGVSSETIRKAVSVLQDVHILSSVKGSGIVVMSVENAIAFTQQYSQTTSLMNIKKSIAESAIRQREEMSTMFRNIQMMMDMTECYNAVNPFVPFKIVLTEECPYIGKSLADLNFWHVTGATVIAIQRSEKTLLSPGPHEKLQIGDVVYFIGEQECFYRVKSFFSNERERI